MKLQITVGKDLYQVKIERAGDGYEVVVNGKPFDVKSVPDGFSIGGKVHKVELTSQQAESVQAKVNGKLIEALILDIVKAPVHQVEEAVQARPSAPSVISRSAKVVAAPMPGKVVKVLVSVGQKVKVGDVILILEAMKMENEIRSPYDGTVKEVRISAGSGVAAEEPLVIME